MQRYFVDVIVGDDILIKGSDAHHIKNVLRMKSGDEIICVANEIPYKCEIKLITEDSVQATAIKQITDTSELPFKITLIYGLVKGDKFDFVVQKATELGVDRIVPMRMKRSVVKYDDKKSANKVRRWNVIAKEAAEQSHRSQIPIITDIIDISRVNDFTAQVKVFAYENEAGSSKQGLFKEAVKFLKPGMEICMVVGPEGGFDPIEVDVLKAAEYHPVSLGSRILRSETAPIYMLSALSYEHELNNTEEGSE